MTLLIRTAVFFPLSCMMAWIAAKVVFFAAPQLIHPLCSPRLSRADCVIYLYSREFLFDHITLVVAAFPIVFALIANLLWPRTTSWVFFTTVAGVSGLVTLLEFPTGWLFGWEMLLYRKSSVFVAALYLCVLSFPYAAGLAVLGIAQRRGREVRE